MSVSRTGKAIRASGSGLGSNLATQIIAAAPHLNGCLTDEHNQCRAPRHHLQARRSHSSE